MDNDERCKGFDKLIDDLESMNNDEPLPTTSMLKKLDLANTGEKSKRQITLQLPESERKVVKVLRGKKKKNAVAMKRGQSTCEDEVKRPLDSEATKTGRTNVQ